MTRWNVAVGSCPSSPSSPSPSLPGPLDASDGAPPASRHRSPAAGGGRSGDGSGKHGRGPATSFLAVLGMPALPSSRWNSPGPFQDWAAIRLVSILDGVLRRLGGGWGKGAPSTSGARRLPRRSGSTPAAPAGPGRLRTRTLERQDSRRTLLEWREISRSGADENYLGTVAGIRGTPPEPVAAARLGRHEGRRVRPDDSLDATTWARPACFTPGALAGPGRGSIREPAGWTRPGPSYK